MQASLQVNQIKVERKDVFLNNIIHNYSYANNYQQPPELSTNDDIDLDQLFEVQKNIEKLKSFLELKENWNGYGAKPFPNELINKCINIISSSFLYYQPEIFPTSRNSIQLEYEKSDGAYLEVEIYQDHVEMLYIDAKGNEFEAEDIKLEEVLHKINEF